MLFLIFYLQYFVLGQNDPPISEDAEVCVEGSKFCDYQSVGKKEQILPKCGKHFASIKNISKLGLSEWLIREIFCLRKAPDDDYKSKNDPESTSTNNSEDDKSSKNRQIIKKPTNYPESATLSTSKSTKDTDEQQFYIPAPFLASSTCNTEIRKIDINKLTSIDSLKCYYKTGDLNLILNTFNYNFNDVDDGTCTENSKKLRSINLRFIYERPNNETIIKKIYKHCTYHEDETLDEYYLQVSVHFYQQDINEQDITNKEIKSGEAGYSDGKPLIAYEDRSGAATQFPIPFGFDCSDLSYTPLLFGYDTISGCTENIESRGAIIQNLKKYTKVAKMGKARGIFNQDWIDIYGLNEISEGCSNLQLIINYEYVGNTKNPQNKIYNASYTCRSTEGNQFLFVVNFLRSSDTSSKAFLPKPKGLPDDTFAPLIN